MSHQAIRQRTGAPRGAAKDYSELYAAIASLPERDRVLIHQVWDGRSLRQLARDLDCNHSALVTRYQRIIRDLRRTMDGSVLGERRVYSDGVYWIKCRQCRVWGESTRRCACGEDPMLRVFDFPGFTVSDVSGSSNNVRSERKKRVRPSYLERHSSELERQADAILRADDERQAREEAS